MAENAKIGDTREGETLRVVADITTKLSNGSLTLEQAKRFAKKQNPFDATITDKDQVLTVQVNYDRSIKDGIKAGKYDWTNSDITEDHFPRTGSGMREVEVILVHFDKSMSSDKVLKELDRRNLRPATLQELLAIGEQHPNKQKDFPMVAFGSAWCDPGGYRRVPGLGWDVSERFLHLLWFGIGWLDICRFAAVRK